MNLTKSIRAGVFTAPLLVTTQDRIPPYNDEAPQNSLYFEPQENQTVQIIYFLV